MEFVDLVSTVCDSVKEVVRDYWKMALVFLAGCLPGFWLYFKNRRRFRMAGAIGKGDVDFLLFSIEEHGGDLFLAVHSIYDTSLEAIYRNPVVQNLVARSCKPFLDTADQKYQSVVMNPLRKAISACFREGTLVRVMAAGPTIEKDFVFALVKIDGGVQNQFRVFIISREHLAIIAALGQDLPKMPPYLTSLWPSVFQMAQRYVKEVWSGPGLLTLGQVNLVCPDYHALRAEAADVMLEI